MASLEKSLRYLHLQYIYVEPTNNYSAVTARVTIIDTLGLLCRGQIIDWTGGRKVTAIQLLVGKKRMFLAGIVWGLCISTITNG